MLLMKRSFTYNMQLTFFPQVFLGPIRLELCLTALIIRQSFYSAVKKEKDQSRLLQATAHLLLEALLSLTFWITGLPG